jgi:putative FmdB family regulatory protein
MNDLNPERGHTMKMPYYRCEDCGYEFEKSAFLPDIEESPLACPACDGLDIQLMEDSTSTLGSEPA